uniref:GrBNV_gp58-like protein n=1 Tax=Nilaparvata lugens endogenous nudivirus TaxID=1487700 RepID=X5G6K2_9VIRU|nr:GrBNV_gp58-like protein [Nilaparvata lugens endogenous nudivirus]
MYIVVFILFFLCLFCIAFSKNSFLNREFLAYRRQLVEPWLTRAVASL